MKEVNISLFTDIHMILVVEIPKDCTYTHNRISLFNKVVGYDQFTNTQRVSIH